MSTAEIEKGGAPAASSGITARVTWRVTDFRSAPDSAEETPPAPMPRIGFINIDLFSGGDSISFGGRSCEGVSFTTSTVDAESYLTTRYGVAPEFLNVTSRQFAVLKTDCDLPGMDEFIQLNDRRLILFIDGGFLFLEPDVYY
jgi:hypothetical protein